MNYLKAACEKLNVDPRRVIKHRVQGDEFVVIVDNGIAGCPKYMVPLADLVDKPATEETDAPEVESAIVSVWDEQPDTSAVTTTDAPDVTFYRKSEEEEPPEPNATDSARDLAFEHGIDIRTVEGSGAGGRIVKKDVEALL